MFKIAYSEDVPDIPESFSKEGKDFLRLCLKRDPAQRPSATQLLGHPFLQDHQGTRVTNCNNISPLRNGPSFTAEAWQQKVTYLTCFFRDICSTIF
jgi:mitogen-activated protein kinase kinase kinase 3